ncbi:MAG: GIY-YIG nuclease family protein [Dehalococcoidia bacterium]|nr:GIY-YIG nuclease family protein [Dehalococcoidia bacterium]
MSKKRMFYVYMLCSRPNGTLYVGVTNDLTRRLVEHRNGAVEGFTKRYAVHRLVCFEETDDVTAAIAHEKQIKGWSRAKKVALIQSENPEWRDLAEGWFN